MNTRAFSFRLVLWHALWLAAIFVAGSAAVYAALGSYLRHSAAEAQTQRAERIAALTRRESRATDAEMIDEITDRFAPEASGRFIRITRADGSVLYQSSAPIDQSFDPREISAPKPRTGTWSEKLPGGPELVLAAVGTGGSPPFFVETGESLAPALLELRRLSILLSIGFFAVGGMALGGGYFLVRRALRPVEEIIRSADRITSRSLSERLPVPATGDEFEHLSRTLNGMMSRLDEAFQYNRRFLADASHELRTPLTVLRGELESVVQDSRTPRDFRDRMASALEEVERLAQIVEGLFAIARLDAGEAQGEWSRLDLAKLATSTAEQMLLLAEDKAIRLSCAADDPVWVEGDRARLKQVVVNLLDNAIKYTGPGGAVELKVTEAPGAARLEISDTGAGIPAEALPHVFERFFRVDPARSRDGGAGLGLSIVRSICLAHGGRVEAQSGAGVGSQFRVELPLAGSASVLETNHTA